MSTKTQLNKADRDAKAIEDATRKRLESNDELARLKAELAAIQAERDLLTLRLATKTKGNPRRAEWMADVTEADCTAAADTILGKAQRQAREELCYTIQKVLRQIPNRQLPKLLAELTEQATENGGLAGDLTADKILTEAMTRTIRGPRKAKEEATNT